MRYILDTDTCIYVLREKQPVVSRMRAESASDLAISSMTEAELRFGAINSSDPQRLLLQLDAFLSAPIQVLSFDREAAVRHAEIRLALRHQPIGERDLVTASVALATGLTVVTCNRREYDRVPGLDVVNWLTG
jgi:tRNA(fMet)-specific endonuclease VapC